MGKRRIRNLLSLGHINLAGFDPSSDRRKEAFDKYKIKTYSDFTSALRDFNPDVFIISTPPNLHMKYAYIGFHNGINCFIEASVVDAEKIKELASLVNKSSLVIVPSCTMRYFPGPIRIKELIRSGAIGQILNINYQTGQYLPDWHPWENIADYYVSSRETGGAREIVPFELTWLNDIFGTPTPISCHRAKLTDMNADIDDIYHFLVRYERQVLANITIGVVFRPTPIREMIISGSEGQITFSGERNIVRYINLDMENWSDFDLEQGNNESGYIHSEFPYKEELQDFITAVKAKNARLFPNSLDSDYLVLQTLYSLEKF